MAKTNKIDKWIENCTSSLLIEAHNKEREVRDSFRKEDLKNFQIRLQQLKKTAEKHNDQLDRISIGIGLIETNPEELIPSTPDGKTVDKCFNKFKREARSTGTKVLGKRQYKESLLLCIQHFLGFCPQLQLNKKDFELSDSTSSNETNAKVSKAIVLYNQFKTEIRGRISYG